jgi:hypothetical protein
MGGAPASPEAPSRPASPADAGAPSAPAKPHAPSSPDKPDAGAPEEKELEWSAGNECAKVDSELKRRMRIFNAKVAKQGFSVVVVRCHRDPTLQKEWHYARFITWSESEVKSALRNDKSDDEVKKIKANALRLFKALDGLKTDDEARQKAQELRSNFKSNPVLPGEGNCPCGCGWSISKHVNDPTTAVDINITKPGTVYGVNPVVNSSTAKSDSNYDLINKLTSESVLVWGINFTQIPADPVHWELPD